MDFNSTATAIKEKYVEKTTHTRLWDDAIYGGTGDV
jgi:hypothetical protein